MADALMVSPSFLPGRGGIESYLAELCSRLAPRVAVLAPARRDGMPLPEDLGYPVHGFGGRLLVPGPRAARAITRAAARESTDRILFGTPWPVSLIGPELARRGLRYAVVVHGAELLLPGAVPVVKAQLARALAGAELLLPVSDFTADQVRLVLERAGQASPPIERLRAIVDLDRFHPGVDTAEVRTRLGIGPDEKVVLYFGRLVERKGVHRLIRAFPKLKERVRDMVLVVAGTGPQERNLRRLAREHKVRVVFTGPVAHDDAPAVFCLADVFVMPVLDRWFGLETEGLGVVLLEAAACGVPCITGRSGGTPEALVDGKTGFVIDARDKNALVERVASLLADPERARDMGAAGRRYVEQEFSKAPIEPLVRWLT